VREWVWNASREDRYVLGGSWRSPAHIYTGFDATDPWSRDLDNGFRCARYIGEPDQRILTSIETPIFDFTGYEPVDDATFATFAAFYEYDRTDLEESRTVVAETADWTREYVELSAAYLDERVPVHVFLPKNAQPPYQSVVYVPGAAAFSLSSSENISEMSKLMFIPQSGRALLYPVLKGSYERRWGRPSRGATERRQRYVWLAQDVMRTVDYVDEREELDIDAVAYMGLSWGAEWALPMALEKRFRATVLIGGALDPTWLGAVPEAVAPWNFVSRITTPTLLVNGRYDFMHPYEESQLPFFDAIDVPEEDKRFVVLETGHLPPNNEVIGYALSWLDARLGPVALTPGGR
jgi:eukaryotic-like serine/threonine-protein kinase